MKISNKYIEKLSEIRELNYPIKIVYFVPSIESAVSHNILDAVFYESYTRWGGVRTLVIPVDEYGLFEEGYEAWLKFFDPGFVFSYVTLSSEQIENIDYLCSPIRIIKHELCSSECQKWREYLPDWSRYFKPLSSLTTLYSPSVLGPRTPADPFPTIMTKGHDLNERFISDNFGFAHDLTNITNPVKGLFNTLCLVPEELSERIGVGMEVTTSMPKALAMIASNKIVTFAKMAMAHSESIPKLNLYSWTSDFNLFIGETCLDRINFWNARNFSPEWLQNPGSLIVSKSHFEQDDFIIALGEFLNRNGFSLSGGQANIAFRSLSLDKSELELIREKVKPHTYHHLIVSTKHYNEKAIPTSEDMRHVLPERLAKRIVKVNERNSQVEAQKPAHLRFFPPQFLSLTKGQWAIELEIERHNNLSRYDNVNDIWQLPRRWNIGSCFTRRLSKISKNNFLTLIPGDDKGFILNSETHQTRVLTKESIH